MKIKAFIAVGLIILLSAFLVKTTGAPVQEIQTVAEFKKVCAQNKPVVIFFHAPFCDACKRMKKPFDDVAQKTTHAQMIKIDVQNKNLQSIVDALEITAVPTIVTRQVGLLDTKQLTKLVQGHTT